MVHSLKRILHYLLLTWTLYLAYLIQFVTFSLLYHDIISKLNHKIGFSFFPSFYVHIFPVTFYTKSFQVCDSLFTSYQPWENQTTKVIIVGKPTSYKTYIGIPYSQGGTQVPYLANVCGKIHWHKFSPISWSIRQNTCMWEIRLIKIIRQIIYNHVHLFL